MIRDDEQAQFDRRWAELAEQLTADGLGDHRKETADPTPPRLAPQVSPGTTSPGLDQHVFAETSGLGAGDGPRDWQVNEDLEEEHFVPPQPPPIGRSEPLLVLAWVAVVGSALCLMIVGLTHWPIHWMVRNALVVALLGGIGLLVWRMPQQRENPEDNGAQV
ncbi:MAG: hypothetical protein LBG70_04480 [Bifidobacteriaceae bacterium]|nr:hypothetical protein [Bifidobacteriaceae bacterium]